MKLDAFEIRRKSFHILLGIALALLIYFNLLRVWIVATIIVAGIILSINYRSLPIVKRMLEIFERNSHMETMPGKSVIYLFIGILLLMLVFSKEIVLASIMMWAFGDSISTLVAKHYGRIKHPWNSKKLVEGTIAGIIAGTITAGFFVYWPYALIASIIAMLIESMDIALYNENIDDNFLVPVISGSVLFIISIL